MTVMSDVAFLELDAKREELRQTVRLLLRSMEGRDGAKAADARSVRKNLTEIDAIIDKDFPQGVWRDSLRQESLLVNARKLVEAMANDAPAVAMDVAKVLRGLVGPMPKVAVGDPRWASTETAKLREHGETIMGRLLNAETEGDRNKLRETYHSIEDELARRPPLANEALSGKDFERLRRLVKLPMERRSADDDSFITHRLGVLVATAERGVQLEGEMEKLAVGEGGTELAERLEEVLDRYHIQGERATSEPEI
jgi:hypothetical protein